MEILDVVRDALAGELGGALLGLYVTGSYVWGDFDPHVSDIDLVAVLDRDVDEPLLARLRDMHRRIEAACPDWTNRVEVVYAGRDMLARALASDGVLTVISPGEPIHTVPANRDWYINWYFALYYGQTLLGEPPRAYMPAVTRDMFVDIVRHEARMWRGHIVNTRQSLPYQCYACMTLCRALYAVTTGEQASKKRAVQWYAQTHPQSAELLDFCWRVREKRGGDGWTADTFYSVAKRFVLAVLGEIEQTA